MEQRRAKRARGAKPDAAYRGAPDGRRRAEGGGPSRGELTIRWFTPRGRAATAELVADLRQADGRHAAEIVAELRREGAADGGLDLRGIDLRGEDLGGAELARADLSGARLEGTTLARADLRGARLSGARLRQADLTGARLQGADLTGADLSFADLTEGSLAGAELSGARLHATCLKRTWAPGIDFGRAQLSEVDLSRVQTEAHRPDPGVRAREALGAPPPSEPRPPTRRFRPLPGRRHTGRATRTGPPRRPARTGGGATLDAALAELLLNRAGVERLTATIDGAEIVLFDARRAARRAA